MPTGGRRVSAAAPTSAEALQDRLGDLVGCVFLDEVRRSRQLDHDASLEGRAHRGISASARNPQSFIPQVISDGFFPERLRNGSRKRGEDRAGGEDLAGEARDATRDAGSAARRGSGRIRRRLSFRVVPFGMRRSTNWLCSTINHCIGRVAARFRPTARKIRSV